MLERDLHRGGLWHDSNNSFCGNGDFTLPFPVSSAAVNTFSWHGVGTLWLRSCQACIQWSLLRCEKTVGFVDGMDSIATAWLLCTHAVDSIRSQAGWKLPSRGGWVLWLCWGNGYRCKLQWVRFGLTDNGSVGVIHLMALVSGLIFHVVLLLQWLCYHTTSPCFISF